MCCRTGPTSKITALEEAPRRGAGGSAPAWVNVLMGGPLSDPIWLDNLIKRLGMSSVVKFNNFEVYRSLEFVRVCLPIVSEIYFHLFVTSQRFQNTHN